MQTMRNCVRALHPKVADISKLKWSDEKWMEARAAHKDDEVYRQPMSIYEVHPGSWKRHPQAMRTRHRLLYIP